VTTRPLLHLTALAAAGLLSACASQAPREDPEAWPPPRTDVVGPRPVAGSAFVASRSTPLTLGEVLTSVALHHPQQLAQLAEQSVALGRQLSADGVFDLELRGRALWDPRGTYRDHEVLTLLEQPTPWRGLSVYGGYRLGAGDFAPYDGKRRTSSTGEAIAGVRLPLLRDGSIDPARAGIAQAEVDVELAELGVAALRLELARRAAQDFWSWVAAGRRAEVARALLDVALSRAAAVREAADRGELAAIEADENDRQVAVRRALRAGAERALEQAALALSLFLRDEAGRPVVPQARWLPPDLPAPELRLDPAVLALHVARAEEARPEPRRLALLAQRAGVDLDLARNQALPWINLTAQVEQELSGGGPDRDGEGGLEVMGGLELRFPVQRRAARGRQAAASAQLEVLTQQLRLARDRIAVEVRDAASALAAATARHEEASRARGLAQGLERAEREALALGQSTLLVVNLREQAAAEATLLVIDAAAEHQRALADWRAALGDVTP
jgi:cobalt-zinc-cadmium efflux system outer membrane protein